MIWLRICTICLALVVMEPAATAIAADGGKAYGTITITVKASPSSSYPSVMTIQSPKLWKSIASTKEESTSEEEAKKQLLDDTDIVLEGQKSTRHFVIFQSGDLLNKDNGQTRRLTGRARLRLLHYVMELRNAHYGEPIAWNEAEKLLPRKSLFTVSDLETGLSFRVQRRAGSAHADVQPLTKEDSRIMKQIYNGKWSWDRRAILVKTENNRSLAASMNGKPHGGDGIPGNDFNGHFCIHFAGSTTHGSHSIDLGHQTMVQKAAGQLDEYLNTLPPNDIVDLFIFALNQKDAHLLGKTVPNSLLKDGGVPLAADPALTMVRRISNFHKSDIQDRQEISIPVRLVVYRQKGQRTVQASFKLTRNAGLGRWQVVEVHEETPIKRNKSNRSRAS